MRIRKSFRWPNLSKRNFYRCISVELSRSFEWLKKSILRRNLSRGNKYGSVTLFERLKIMTDEQTLKKYIGTERLKDYLELCEQIIPASQTTTRVTGVSRVSFLWCSCFG